MELGGVPVWLLASLTSLQLIADGRKEKPSIFIYNLFLPCSRQDCSRRCCQAVPWKESLIYRSGLFWNAFLIVLHWGKALQGQMRDGREPIPCPGVGVVTRRALCLQAGLVGQEKPLRVWLWAWTQASISPFSQRFSCSLSKEFFSKTVNSALPAGTRETMSK